ncbi:helix-turn-helix transcriptional regulator [Nonomuraea rhizosphaerae]|uniref:helix-turn-helix transcriptional regulator n=1 Tax=Nonomuraea rhizosphaerae TaxID=2665663 RepID=UPI001C6005F8|nr:helix-turn-helix domain-containing protein [Nonomuraea rhizosphaerae]
MNVVDKLWTIDDVSAFLGVPIATLYQWRHHRTGPRGHKIGRHLRYVPEDVMSWVQDQE